MARDIIFETLVDYGNLTFLEKFTINVGTSRNGKITVIFKYLSAFILFAGHDGSV